MRNAYGRRIGLKRPKASDLLQVEAEIADLEAVVTPSKTEIQRLEALREEHERLLRRRRAIAYIDPMDVRYNNFVQQPQPNANAVMFCLMDVSASMGEREKDLAKRFFMLLHLFLKRR